MNVPVSCLRLARLGPLLFGAGLLLLSHSAHAQHTLAPIADAFVYKGAATTNYGARPQIGAKLAADTTERHSYLTFDLTPLGGASTVTSAKLRLYGRLSSTSNANIATDVYAVADTTWNENTLTWDNKPVADAAALATTTVANDAAQWIEWDVTGYVQAEKVAGRVLVSVCLKNPVASTTTTHFHAKEVHANIPQLVVTATTTATPTADAFVRDGSAYQNSNYGADTTLVTKKSTSSYNRWAYLKFDLAGAGAGTITSAKLRLYGRVSSNTSISVPTAVYGVADTAWTETALTWTNKPASGTTALASTTLTNAPAQYYEWDVTGHAQQEQTAGRSQISVVLKNTTVSNPVTFFNAKEATVFKPEIVVTTQSVPLLPPASQIGQWSPVTNWSFLAIHTNVLPTGKVLIWGRENHLSVPAPENPDRLQTYLWDPATETFADLPSLLNTTSNLFCTGHSLLPDGRLLVTGGHIRDGRGLAHTNLFNFADDTWTRVDDMNAGRWYPTNVTLANGDVLVLSGSDALGTNNKLPQVWKTTEGGGWRNLTNAQLQLKLYPWLHLAPNGKVFVSGPDRATRYLDTTGLGAWTTLANTNFGYRGGFTGSSVMFEPGKVLILGGSGATNTAETIDLNAMTPAWTYTGSMNYARRHVNSTLLPDGTVLVTGGTQTNGASDNDAVLAPELWNPTTGTWTLLASMPKPRLYHSTAVLLPDGRVLSGGGGQGGGFINHPDSEIYSPPYLFKGPRPQITLAPDSVGYNQTFALLTPDAASIQKVSLIRLGSVTHSFNMNQRFNALSFTPLVDGLSITTPLDGNLCPPGHYLLFIVNSQGVPSVAKVIQIQ